jgi:hypothetical protein
VEGPIKHAGIIGDAENDQVRVIVDFTSCKNDKGHAEIDDDCDVLSSELFFRYRSVHSTISSGNERCHQNLRVIE